LYSAVNFLFSACREVISSCFCFNSRLTASFSLDSSCGVVFLIASKNSSDKSKVSTSITLTLLYSNDCNA